MSDRRMAVPVGIGAVLLAAVLAIGELTVRMHLLWPQDQRLSRGVFDLALEHPPLYDLAAWVGRLTEPTWLRLLVLVTAIVMWRRGLWREAAWWLLATLLGGAAAIGLKLLVARDRPDWPDPAGTAAELAELPGRVTAAGYTFPSGHAANSALFACCLLITVWPWLAARGRLLLGLVGATVAMIVGASRVLLGVHHVSDVLAGWALGVAVALLLLPLRPRRGIGTAGAAGRGG